MPAGGRRPGAGRKPSTLKGIAKRLPKHTAEVLLAEIKANQRLVQLAMGKDEWLAFAVIKFLWEQAHGKAVQAIREEGPQLQVEYGFPIPAEFRTPADTLATKTPSQSAALAPG